MGTKNLKETNNKIPYRGPTIRRFFSGLFQPGFFVFGGPVFLKK
jgi:hypothetical protein